MFEDIYEGLYLSYNYNAYLLGYGYPEPRLGATSYPCPFEQAEVWLRDSGLTELTKPLQNNSNAHINN